MITTYNLKKFADILDMKVRSEDTSLSPSLRDKYRKEYLMGKKLMIMSIGEIKYWRVIDTLEGLIG